MRKENVQKMRRMLVKAVNAHLKNGGHVASGGFVQTLGGITCYCPLACLVGSGGPEDSQSYAELVSKKLGFKLTPQDMWQFINGFDNALLCEKDDDMYEMGQSLRTKYLKEVK